MTIEELKKDSEEFSNILEHATRQRVKDAIIKAKADVDKEIVTLELKAQQAAERAATAPKRYLVELHEYAWDQSDKFVKLYITLDGVQNIDETNVQITFTPNTVRLHVIDLNGKDYGLQINNLLEPIDVEKSYRKVKTGMIAVYMKKKVEFQHWEQLTTLQKKLKQKQDDDLKEEPGNDEEALVNIMKKLYKTGDSQTKQMIAKAWTESEERFRTGTSPLMDLKRKSN